MGNPQVQVGRRRTSVRPTQVMPEGQMTARRRESFEEDENMPQRDSRGDQSLSQHDRRIDLNERVRALATPPADKVRKSQRLL